jgi:hypothetical protein
MILFISVLSCACIVLYLTHPNQIWLKTTLDKKWRLLGWGLTIVSFIIALMIWPIDTSIYLFLTFIMLVFGLLPFIPLLKRKGEE